MDFKLRVLCAVAIMVAAMLPAFHARADEDGSGTANIGERLFLETRFAEFFYTNSGGDANFQLTNGDPVMDVTVSATHSPLPGPFAGQSMNCRACHLVEEHESTGNRTYCDFGQRSPIPNIGDGRYTTPRNSPTLVNSLLPRSVPLFLHLDGQFASPQDLVVGTLTGRNFGWNPTQYAAAIHHIAHIIRDDDGTGALAQQYGGYSYAVTLEGLAQVTDQYIIAPQYRMNVTITDTNDPNYITDEQIVQNVAALMQAYMETLVFSQDTNGLFNGSPYDVFLIKNGLPREPDFGEAPLQYSQRLLQLITNLTNPQFVTDPADGHYATHNEPFKFGTNELAGLKMFFTLSSSNLVQAGAEVGNCVACHTPPGFSDFVFHNTGAAQEEYDAIHGAGAFLALVVPPLSMRATNYDAYLPATPNHPYATGVFETPPTNSNPALVDLGLWNVFANPDFPAPQPGFQQILPQLVPGLSPQISSVFVVSNQLVFSGANGSPDWPYYVLASTNLAQPMSEWSIIATNTVDDAGNFSFTNSAGSPQGFYALSMDTSDRASAAALPYTVALFKTPTVRDISSSEPYLHTGRMNAVEDVINFYLQFSAKARAGALRNIDPQMGGILLDAGSVSPLAAFLHSLDEDYEDIPCPCDPPAQ